MTTRRWFCLLALLSLMPGSTVAAIFEIPDGDYFALRDAIRQAETTSEADTILLSPGGNYRPGGAFTWDNITTPIAIYGQGATLDGDRADGGRLVTVEDGGRLTLADIAIVNVSYQTSSPIHTGGVINNDGSLVLRNVTIADSTITTGTGNVMGGAIANRGDARLLNTTLSGITVVGSANGSALRNAGSATLSNTTIVNNIVDHDAGGMVAVDASGASSTNLSNSIIANNTETNCTGTLSSSGGNIDSDDSCFLDHGSDQPGIDPQLAPLADNGGGVLTHAPAGGSPAVDAGFEAFCAAMDARGVPRPGAGNADAGDVCDSGAHEIWDGGFSFTEGATGSWFNPSQNGHGFMFELLPNDRFLVTWFVFDPAGNREWVQALGEINDGVARLTAYQVLGGAFPPSFDEESTTLRYWGTLSIVFTTCNTGAVAWMPDVPGYSQGGMRISRITNVAGATCN